MKILITGSSGYIGTNLIEYLQQKNNHKDHIEMELVGLDIRSSPLYDYFNIPFIHNTILDAVLPRDVTHVIHLAGKTGVGPSWDPEEIKTYYESNVVSSQYIFDTYKRPPFKNDIPILYATSSSTDELRSPYAMTKAVVELIAPKNAIGMKFFTVYGGKNPREDMLYGKALNRNIDELTENKRDFTHVDYICESIYSLLICGKSDKIYDIGTGNPKTPKEFLESISSLPTTIINSIPIIQKTDESLSTCADPTEIEKIRKRVL
ncbi:MAG: NAD-dependent epimerase/dehydratase family protein [Lentimicrobiaceae bacterium]|jgi:nucleoside-diphosphate-sugar epimerase|nr:NAD-dependent epimerase/dehydratase family protein [Lentimicrobiaceae bacterium]